MHETVLSKTRSTTAQVRGLIRKYFRPHWPSGVALLALLGAGTALQLAQPRLLADFVDRAGSGDPLPALWRIATAFLFVSLSGRAIRVVEAYLAQRLALITTNELRADLMLHCLQLDMGFHHEHRPGELIQRVDGDVVRLANLFSTFLVALLGSVLLLVGVLVVVFFVDWRLGAGLTIFSMAVLGLLYRLRFAGQRYWQNMMQANAEQFGFIAEHLGGTEDIRSSGATGFVMRGFWGHAREVLRWHSRARLVGNLTGHVAYASLGLGATGALAVGATLFLNGRLTLGTVFLIESYAWMLFGPLAMLNRQVAELHQATAAARRVGEIFDTNSAIADGPGAEFPKGALALDVEHVDFGYHDGRNVLKDVCVELKAGRVLGVLGRTGSGKTTLGRLIARFHDPQVGSIRVGGIDLRQATLSHLRSRIGIVTQDVQLFEGTLRDNLTFFDSSISDERITEALMALGIHRDLETHIFSGGVGISAGEAQLTAFARVFLRDPGLIILDEATSRLDPATEQQIEAATDKLLGGRTAVVIAHRLHTVLTADEILILEAGRVIEHGSRADLQADQGSRFSELLRTGMEEVLA